LGRAELGISERFMLHDSGLQEFPDQVEDLLVFDASSNQPQ
jgi:hypothetical protein